MKKFILGLAFLSIATASFTASAQKNQRANNCASVNCEQTVCKSCDCAFSNLNLTDTQKTRIADLKKGLEESKKELRAKAKQARENKDTTFNGRQAMRDLRSKYVTDLGTILDSSQYVEFLKNYYVNNPSHKDKNKHFRGGSKDGKHFGKFDKKRDGRHHYAKDGAKTKRNGSKINGDAKKAAKNS